MSIDTRRYYFGVIVPAFSKLLETLLKQEGYKFTITKKESHQWLKNRFGIGSTKNFKHKDWEELINKSQAYAATMFNYYIPDANENKTMQS
jgi:hypothetical protein